MLSQNHWNFQIAKSVSTPDQAAHSNVVWQSKALAPRTIIQWKDLYGLNWTSTLPDPGVTVTIGGKWQACAKGEVFDIDSNGFFTASQVAKDKNFLKVGKVNYQYPGAPGLHIIIGIQNSEGYFDPIYVDPTALALNDTASYQPQEEIQWWYQTDMRTSTMISTASTSLGGVDFSKPAPTTNKYYYSTTYNYESGRWITSEDRPPQTLYVPPLTLFVLEPTRAPHKLFSIWSSVWKGVLSIAVGKDKQAKAQAKLKSLLDIQYKDVKVKFLDGLDIGIELGTPKNAEQNSNDAIGAPDDNIKKVIADCFQYLLDDGILPQGETWVVKKALDY